MHIPMPAGTVIAAAAKARVTLDETIATAREKMFEQALTSLIEGAKRNGYNTTDSVKVEMQDMARRDVDHAMERHPGVVAMNNLIVLTEMASFVQEDDPVLLDEMDFEHIKEHLLKPQQSLRTA